MTSLPQFPNIPTSSQPQSNGVFKHSLPPNPADIFDKNLSANAQHFMCISFEHSSVTLDSNNEIPFTAKHLLAYRQSHVNFLFLYLKTIHPAIVGTNFNDRNPYQQIWRNYFSLLKRPYEEAKYNLSNSNLNVQFKEYNHEDLPAQGVCNKYRGSKLFPLSASPFYFTANGNLLTTFQTYTSRWGSLFASQNGCQTGNESACTSSFTFNSTAYQSALTGQLFAKHGLAVMDIYDDWATLQLVRSQTVIENTYENQVVTKYGLLVQTWIDGKGALPTMTDKKIYDADGDVMSTVHVDNMGKLKMPVKPNVYYKGNSKIEYPVDPIKVPSVGSNHSKIALGLPLHTFNSDYDLSKEKYSFIPLFFVGDLNRIYTQARLKGLKQGRGGGIMATGEWSLWSAMMLLNPRPHKPKFVANRKKAAIAMQDRLTAHTSASNLSQTHLSGFEVESIRSYAFECLGLSKSEGKRMPKAIPFTPFLNELAKFTRQAIRKSEYSAFVAFKKMFHKFEVGQVEGAADSVWKAQREQEKTEEFGHYTTNVLQNIPQLHLYREPPGYVDWSEDEYELGRIESDAPYIINDDANALEITTGSSTESLIQLLSSLTKSRKNNKEVQTSKELNTYADESDEDKESEVDEYDEYEDSYFSARLVGEVDDDDDDDDWDNREFDYSDDEEEEEEEEDEYSN